MQSVWSLGLAVVFVAPFGYLIFRSIELGFSWETLTEAWDPLWNTFVLATSVAVAAAVVATALAWFITRTDIPARRLWSILVSLPLAFPSFVGATALLAGFAKGGLVEDLLSPLLSSPILSPLGIESIPQIKGFWGAWLVLTMFTYPYVYLPVQARLATLPFSLEESAQLLGRRPITMFTSVVLPQIWTAVTAGSLLVFLYTLSDFGAVALLRYNTLTRSIFTNRLLDQEAAVTQGLLLAVLAFAVILLERRLSRLGVARLGVEASSKSRSSPPRQILLGRWRWPATIAVGGWIGMALLGPVSVMGYWLVRGIANRHRVTGPLRINFNGIVEPALNTLFIGLVTAVVAVAIMIPLSRLIVRYKSKLGVFCSNLVLMGFALPGLVIALAFVFWVLRSPLVGFYQSLPLLVLAYCLHFGAQAARVGETAVETVPKSLSESSRSLGAGRVRSFVMVELPLMVPGLLAGAGLVLLTTMKELPITLLLHPIGFDTLSIRIWSAAEELAFAQAGLESLTLITLSAVLTWLLILRRAKF